MAINVIVARMSLQRKRKMPALCPCWGNIMSHPPRTEVHPEERSTAAAGLVCMVEVLKSQQGYSAG